MVNAARATSDKSWSFVAAFAAVLIASSSAIASTPQQRPQFRTTVEVVQMQVALADSRGDHIPNLTREDFILRIDGRIRDLTAVYEVDLRQLSPDDDFTDDAYMPAAGWRQFMLFFDFSFSTKRGILRARDAAEEFVRNHTHPKDLVAVSTFSTVSGLRLVSPFTADRGQVLAALGGFGLDQADNIVDPAGFAVQPFADALQMQQNAPDAAPGSLQEVRNQMIEDTLFANFADAQRQDFRRYREEVVNYADQLVGLGNMLTATRGRKHVLLFTAGFDDTVLTGQSLEQLAADTERIQQGESWAVNSETRFGSADLRESLEKAVQNLQASDTVFHAFDVSGLANESVDDTFQTSQSGKQGISYIAEGTNGTITWNANDLVPALATLAENTARYYVLAYSKDPADKAVVQVDVDVQRPGVQIVAAPRRFSPPPAYADMDARQRQLQLSEFVTKGIVEEDLTFDVRAVPFAGTQRVSQVAVLVEMPFDQLRMIADARGDGAAQLDIMGYVIDKQGRMRDLFSRRVSLNVDSISERMVGLPFRYYDLLWSTPGDYEVRVLVRDADVGLLSTRTVDAHVPGFHAGGDMLISGPVSVDSAHPGLIMRGIDPAAPPEHRSGGPVNYPFVIGTTELTPQVYTLLQVGGLCQFMVVAHNVQTHPFTGRAQTDVTATAIDELGQVHQLAGIRLLAQEFDADKNTTTLLVEAQLPAGLGEGAYLLDIDIIDTIAGQTVQQTMPFLVVGAPTNE